MCRSRTANLSNKPCRSGFPTPYENSLNWPGEFITDGRGEAVSISDVAKFLLESARQDRLDFRLEAAELHQSPTSSLLHIRRKLEEQQTLSRAEWVFLAQYVQVSAALLRSLPSLSQSREQ